MPGRCFVAIELSAAAVDALVSVSHEFRELAPEWQREKWVAEGLHHITVAFAGAVPDADLPDWIARLHQAGERQAPFSMRLSGAAAVPGPHRAQMVWAVLDGESPRARVMRDDVRHSLGLTAEPAAFRPHVTLARARRPRSVPPVALAHISHDLAALGKTAVGSVSVHSLTVFSSTLGTTGPTYQQLAVIPLTGETAAPTAD